MFLSSSVSFSVALRVSGEIKEGFFWGGARGVICTKGFKNQEKKKKKKRPLDWLIRVKYPAEWLATTIITWYITFSINIG